MSGLPTITTGQRTFRIGSFGQEQTLPEHLQCDQLLIGPGLCHSRNAKVPSCYHSVTDFGRSCALV